MPLPRSPLFIAHNVSSSPEHRPTSGLTPRVVSRVATHNTPGILFSRQPRRLPRQSVRKLRHQTNSFSFDSSERASAVYEQDRTSSTSTTENSSRLLNELSLHDELHGSSLYGSSISSETRSPSPGNDLVADASTLSLEDEIAESQQTTLAEYEGLFSSPPLPQISQLSLPPPFSISSRNSSGAEVLPSVKANISNQHPPTSPIPLSTSPTSPTTYRQRSAPSSPADVLSPHDSVHPSLKVCVFMILIVL